MNNGPHARNTYKQIRSEMPQASRSPFLVVFPEQELIVSKDVCVPVFASVLHFFFFESILSQVL